MTQHDEPSDEEHPDSARGLPPANVPPTRDECASPLRDLAAHGGLVGLSWRELSESSRERYRQAFDRLASGAGERRYNVEHSLARAYLAIEAERDTLRAREPKKWPPAGVAKAIRELEEAALVAEAASSIGNVEVRAVSRGRASALRQALSVLDGLFIEYAPPKVDLERDPNDLVGRTFFQVKNSLCGAGPSTRVTSAAEAGHPSMPSPSPKTIAGLNEVLTWLAAEGYEPVELMRPEAKLWTAGRSWHVDNQWFIEVTAPPRQRRGRGGRAVAANRNREAS